MFPIFIFKSLSDVCKEEYYYIEIVKHEWDLRSFSGSQVVYMRNQYRQNCRNERKKNREVLWIKCSLLWIKCFNPSGEFCYRIMICFRELFRGLFFGRCIWRRFCFGTARGANATGLNSGFSNSSLFNIFFQFLQSAL